MILADTSAWVEYDRATGSVAEVTDFEAAARVYRRCRQAGVTPRGMVDCTSVAAAYRCGAALLSWDVDMDRVARVIGVDLDEASLRA